MKKIRAMIMDDSTFSRTILGDALEQAGIEVVASVGDLDSMLEEYRQCRPDIVTMDIAMPGADGFECSKALFREDHNVRIILVSSMKDDATIAEAKKIGIAGYLQKPFDNDELVSLVRSIMSPDELFCELDSLYLDAFKEALADSFTRMTKTTLSFVEGEGVDGQYTSQGVAVVIGIIGKYSGRMLFDLSADTAQNLAKATLRRDARDQDEVLAMAAEFANIVSGVACSTLNKKNAAYGLRVAPPSVFYGSPAAISSPFVQTKAVNADSEFGKMYLSIGFKKTSPVCF